MWCTTCQQDVSAVTEGGSEGFTCPRCGTTSRANTPSDDAATLHEIRDLGVDLGGEDLPSSGEGAASNPFDFGHEQLNAELDRVDRLLKRPPIWASSDLSAMANENTRLDEQPEPVATAGSSATGARPVLPPNPPRRVAAPMAWLLVAVGLSALSCGGALLVWSHLLTRPDLWQLGLVVTPSGLFSMVLGLLLRIERIWAYQRATCERVIEMDRELRELDQTTRLLSTQASARPASPSQAFYTHLAHGAAPHMLVSDLRGQLDLLAQRLAAERR